MVKYRDKPCEGTACGWPYEGFHICLNLPLEIMRRVEDGLPRRTKSSEPRYATKKGTEENKRAISAGVKEHHANDPRKIERNKEIIRLYSDEEQSMVEVAKRLHLDHKTVMNVLHNAAADGDVIIRRAARRSGRR